MRTVHRVRVRAKGDGDSSSSSTLPGVRPLFQNSSYCTVELMIRGWGQLLFHSVHDVQPDFSESVDKCSQGPMSMFSS